jgi:hypothetical protein
MNPTTRTGAILLAVLDVIVIVFPIVTEAPTDQLVVGLVVGVLILVALALWVAGRAPRVAMWVAVVLSGLSALAALPPLFLPEVPGWAKVVMVVYVVGVIIGVALVRGELGRRRTAPGAGARVA